MCCIPDIGSTELGWMTSRRDRNVGKVFFMKSGDGRSVYASSKGGGMGRFAIQKHREDLRLGSRGKDFHDGQMVEYGVKALTYILNFNIT